MTKQIPLTQGKVALVDDEWHGRLLQFKWWFTGRYAITHAYINGRRYTIGMHRMVAGLQPGDSRQVDHIDGDRLNNQARNLRVSTRAQNQMNHRRRIDNKSGYMGVTWHKREKVWYAQVRAQNVNYVIGRFDDPQIAAKARDRAALKLHGEFARLNLPLTEILSDTDPESFVVMRRGSPIRSRGAARCGSDK